MHTWSYASAPQRSPSQSVAVLDTSCVSRPSSCACSGGAHREMPMSMWLRLDSEFFLQRTGLTLKHRCTYKHGPSEECKAGLRAIGGRENERVRHGEAFEHGMMQRIPSAVLGCWTFDHDKTAEIRPQPQTARNIDLQYSMGDVG